MNLKRIILGEKKASGGLVKKAYEELVRRAINHVLSEGKIIRSQDKVVYNFLKSVYDKDHRTIRTKYRAYIRLRDYKLKKHQSTYETK